MTVLKQEVEKRNLSGLTSSAIRDWRSRQRSTSINPTTILNSFLDDILSRRQADGTAPTSHGLTQVRPQVANAEEAFNQAKEWSSLHMMDKRGEAFEGVSPSQDDYRQRRMRFLSESEGNRRFAYDDVDGKRMTPGARSKGNVTVGIGFNMERPDARGVFHRVLGIGGQDFDRVKSGDRPLESGQIRRLFDYTIQEAESIVKAKLGDVPLTDNQRMSLVSLAFNHPKLIGPNLVAKIKAGDSRAAAEEILYESNRKGNRGLAARRYREASMFTGSVNMTTDKTKAAEEGLTHIPEFSEYLKNFA